MEYTTIDTDAINTTKRELSKLLDFFSSSPNVLADSKMTGDPFVLMRHFINTDWNNMTARLLFTSARKLYRDFGSNSALYFELIEDLFSRIQACENQTEARRIIDAWTLEMAATQTFPAATLEDLDSLGFDATISQAIHTADGGLIRLIPDEAVSHAYIDTALTATFPVVDTLEAAFNSPATLVLAKPLQTHQLAGLLAGTDSHVLVLTLGHSRKLTDFAAQNDTRLTLIELYQEYAAADIFADLCALTGQINTPSGIPQTLGRLKAGAVHSGILTLQPKRSRLLDTAIRHLTLKHASESSPLVRSLLESRLTRLHATATDVHYPARTQLEATANDAYYTTQLLEASNSLGQSSIPAPHIPYSATCFSTCARLAAADMTGLFSPVKLTKHSTDDTPYTA